LLAQQQLRTSATRWPIFEPAGTPPPGWPGWPGGKQFALVLTHDVEGPRGLANCERLMELEMELGFRSSFNFIPEGSYVVPDRLRDRMRREGFEVGVHDLHHNGKLYRSKERFDAAAPRINRYLREWNAVGFRSGFMHRNLDWLHALEIEYDMSTFDTDPFEPQPEGVHTIFPFWISRSARELKAAEPLEGAVGEGYLELPYTLPQDSTVFLLLGDTTIATWTQKLDWIVKAGGMALLNVHPDYMTFGEPSQNTFPSSLYREFLIYIRKMYLADTCALLPKQVAAYAREVLVNTVSAPA
jgi:hypothetical protein